jgi:hypothetical protein
VIRLEPGETKNKEARTLPLIGELPEMLALLKQRRDQFHPRCELVFSRFGKPILKFYAAWENASKRARLLDEHGKVKILFHDLRRTGVRNLIRAGVPERVAMTISGHKTGSVLDRYNVVDEKDVLLAGERLENYIRSQSEAIKDKSSTSVQSTPPLTLPAQHDKTKDKLLN